MSDLSFVNVVNGDITINVAVEGAGPLILCVHGFPELWYSWRHQMAYFAERGYRVAAMDVRGYGGSSAPHEIADYTLSKMCSDAVAVIDELGDGQAIVLGHDWGAPIAWNTARFHPDRVRAVAGLSVPYFPVGTDNPLDRWKALYTDQGKFFYQLYFQAEGVAEAELSADSLASIRKIYYAASGDIDGFGLTADKEADAKMLDGLVDPDPFPSWASAEDLQVYADAMDVSGWRGALNRYRAQALDADELGSRPEPNLKQPSAFIGGERDVVRRFMPDIDPYDYADLACDDFRGTTIVPGAGHWVQQERPRETNAALEAFFGDL